MKTALTRLATVGVIAIALLTAACMGSSPTDPLGSNTTTSTGIADPPDEVVKR